MSSTLNRRSTLEATVLAGFESTISAFIDDLRSQGIAGFGRLKRYPGPARHFLVWLHLNGIELETADGAVIDRFLLHDCECRAAVPARVQVSPWRKCRTSPYVMRFVRFLERTGRIETPDELDDNLRILDSFLKGLRGDGYARTSIDCHYAVCAGLIVWLHLSRLRLRDVKPDVHTRFRNKRFICSIPGVYCGQRMHSSQGSSEEKVRKFLGYLAEIGQIERVDRPPEDKALPVLLGDFSSWLDRNRGISTKTIRDHIQRITAMLQVLGQDPGTYDAALVRRALRKQMTGRTRDHIRRMTFSMRVYLRFLASESLVPATLVEAVPIVPQWSLATLPRYISSDDMERTIASCGETPVGIRDRAILLLLARLALRAGDITNLRLRDIDWDRAELRVSGKSRQWTALPLPQDAGDALHAYIATVRRNVDEEKVFLRAFAPYRPLSSSSRVSSIVCSALDRAEVTTFANRGAHVFRHSQATALLRSGATLDVIGALLRHASPNSTMIYAKTDVVMLQEIAQPWIGGLEQ